MTTTATPVRCEYTGWHKPLRVLLTATSNPYLADVLPAVGLLTVHETGLDGSAAPRRVGFQRERPDGTLEALVTVDDAAWSYPAPPKPCVVCNGTGTLTYHRRHPAGGGGSNRPGPCFACA